MLIIKHNKIINKIVIIINIYLYNKIIHNNVCIVDQYKYMSNQKIYK